MNHFCALVHRILTDQPIPLQRQFANLFLVIKPLELMKLKTGGVAFVGGGFGKYTPPEIISRIGKRSEELNAEMAKVRVSLKSVQNQLRLNNLAAKAEIITEGGLWILIKK